MRRPLLALLASLALAASGCERTKTQTVHVSDPQLGCRDAGTCECATSADCTDSSRPVCVNGQCVVAFVYVDGGTSDAGFGDGGDGCGIRPNEPEQCNGRDDDCDGQVDENYLGTDGAFSTVSNCGACGVRCDSLFTHLELGTDGMPVVGATACVDHGQGFTCEPVLCESGHAVFRSGGVPVACLPVTVANCQPCLQASDCGAGVGHVCRGVANEGSHCFQYCDSKSGDPACTGATGVQGCCPSGFTCTESGADAICLPDANSCACRADSVGLTRVCQLTSSADGTTCLGVETCESAGGGVAWSSCASSFVSDICDTHDNDCNGTIDDAFRPGGVYSLDRHCGGCNIDCTARWTTAIHHATGACDAGGGSPVCRITSCATAQVGGGTQCRSDAECAGNASGTTCDPVLRQCVGACSVDGDCGGGGRVCRGGSCTIPCASDATCSTTFGAGSVCASNACVRPYAYVDRNGLDLDGCECPSTADSTDEPDVASTYAGSSDLTPVDRDCDGIDGDVDHALFVVAGGSGSGTLASPLGSIQAAIDAFVPGTHTQILVATGNYGERVVLKAGVRLFGGYSVDFRRHDPEAYPTVIEGPEPDFSAVTPAHGVLVAADIATPTLVTGFVVLGYDVSPSSAGSGQPSYAVLIERCTSALELRANYVLGGRGGNGRSGNEGAVGAAGANGSNGQNAWQCASPDCAGQSRAGGAGGQNASCSTANACPGMEADTDATQVANAPPVGCTYGAGGGRGTYNGGGAQYCKYDFNPPSVLHGASGTNGSNGTNGSAGTGCANAAGSVVAGRWTPATAGAGGAATAGTGGMGGAAGGWATNNKAATCTIPAPATNFGDLGGSGGGGGAGGCGGSGGQPGTSGGASLAVFVVPTSGGQVPTLSGNLIERGFGGDGGRGGPGGGGGRGGEPGLGGQVAWPSWAVGLGGNGGLGGYGGDGGGGGGGCGGPSWSIAVAGTAAPAWSTANSFAIPDGTATGGSGGTGGYSSGSSAGGNGSNGASGNVHAY